MEHNTTKMILHLLASVQVKLVYSFLVGSLGSAAYITALYFKFIGDSDDNRSIIFKPFCKKYTNDTAVLKCLWYCVIGGFIAVVFQFDVPNFVAVQSLILGATWPAIVSQFLSGRMASATKPELDKLNGLDNSKSPAIDQVSIKERLNALSESFKPKPQSKPRTKKVVKPQQDEN